MMMIWRVVSRRECSGARQRSTVDVPTSCPAARVLFVCGRWRGRQSTDRRNDSRPCHTRRRRSRGWSAAHLVLQLLNDDVGRRCGRAAGPRAARGPAAAVTDRVTSASPAAAACVAASVDGDASQRPNCSPSTASVLIERHVTRLHGRHASHVLAVVICLRNVQYILRFYTTVCASACARSYEQHQRSKSRVDLSDRWILFRK